MTTREPAAIFKNHLRKYGLTVGDYWTAYSNQDMRCLICSADIEPSGIRLPVGQNPPKRKTAHIDHDHSTGKFRGLLCITCNLGLGAFQDSPDLLVRAAEYLQ